MAAIAYITNKKMMEFHRLNRNTEINFWRTTAAKRIQDFHKGDLLFFLAKGTEKGREKEKGIIGYGKLEKSINLTFPQMWNQFKDKNGFASKKELEEELITISKQHQIPEKLNCLVLKDVIYFQAPVYMSEIGVSISKRLESYFYIDKENLYNSIKILEVAKQIGTDLWFSEEYERKHQQIQKDAVHTCIKNIAAYLKDDCYTSYEKRTISRYITSFQKEKKGNYKKLTDTEFMEEKENRYIIYFPYMMNASFFSAKLQYLIGHCRLYQGMISPIEQAEIQVCILFHQEPDNAVKEMLKEQKIYWKRR